MEQSHATNILQLAIAQTQPGVQPGVLPNSQNTIGLRPGGVFNAALLKLLNPLSQAVVPQPYQLYQVTSESVTHSDTITKDAFKEQDPLKGQLLPLNSGGLTSLLEAQLKTMHLSQADSQALGSNLSLRALSEKCAPFVTGQVPATDNETSVMENVLVKRLSDATDRSQFIQSQANQFANTNGPAQLVGANTLDNAMLQSNGDPRFSKLEQTQTILFAMDNIKDGKLTVSHGVDGTPIEYSALNAGNTSNSKLESKRVDNTLMSQDLKNPNWASEFANKVVWLTKQDMQVAQIKLNPPHLGPIEVRIAISNEQANVSFIAAHASVREAIENAIPKLREMFMDSGFQSLDVTVANHGETKHHKQSSDPSTLQYLKSGNRSELDLLPADVCLSSEKNVTSVGLLDIYA